MNFIKLNKLILNVLNSTVTKYVKLKLLSTIWSLALLFGNDFYLAIAIKWKFYVFQIGARLFPKRCTLIWAVATLATKTTQCAASETRPSVNQIAVSESPLSAYQRRWPDGARAQIGWFAFQDQHRAALIIWWIGHSVVDLSIMCSRLCCVWCRPLLKCIEHRVLLALTLSCKICLILFYNLWLTVPIDTKLIIIHDAFLSNLTLLSVTEQWGKYADLRLHNYSSSGLFMFYIWKL